MGISNMFTDNLFSSAVVFSLLKNFDGVLIQLSPDLRIVDFNHAAEKLYGYEKKLVLDK